MEPYLAIANAVVGDPKFKLVALYPKWMRCSCTDKSTFAQIVHCDDYKSHMNIIKNTRPANNLNQQINLAVA